MEKNPLVPGLGLCLWVDTGVRGALQYFQQLVRQLALYHWPYLVFPMFWIILVYDEYLNTLIET